MLRDCLVALRWPGELTECGFRCRAGLRGRQEECECRIGAEHGGDHDEFEGADAAMVEPVAAGGRQPDVVPGPHVSELGAGFGHLLDEFSGACVTGVASCLGTKDLRAVVCNA